MTRSGLSITEWGVVSGIVIPLSKKAWVEEKSKYEQTPEYKLINPEISLNEFKKIYVVEYIHRILGRLLFFALLLPYLYFTFRGRLSGIASHLHCITALLGVCVQGLFGWYMVYSGLQKDPQVSHYLLSLHLGTSLTIFAILWYPLAEPPANTLKYRTPLTLVCIATVVQIILGGFTAGLKAGMIYNTFPLMGEELVPALSLHLDDPVTVQFLHRTLGSLVLIGTAVIAFIEKRKECIVLLVITVTQFVLGVITLVYILPVALASAHQLLAFVLFGYQIKFLKRSPKRE